MNSYVTGNIIKKLRENKDMTQLELANTLCVSDKTISKWETGRGLPDISLIDGLAKALGVSIIELTCGELVANKNISANMMKSSFYVCPICGNVIYSIGDTVVSCHGITLPKLEADYAADANHEIHVEEIESDYYVTLQHSMTKEHYISFMALVTVDKVEIIKLYPEQNAEVRFPKRAKRGIIYAYCNKEGLIKKEM